MEDKERCLWPGRKLEELGDDSHEVGTKKRFPVGSSISSGEFSSDDFEDGRLSPCIYKCEQGLTGKESCLL